MISAAAPHQEQRLTPQVVKELISLPDLAPAGRPALAVINANPNKKKVLFVTSELADLVKTGGLGDVSAALPRAMRHLHDVRVLIPGYPQVLTATTRSISSANWVATPRCRHARSGAWTSRMAWLSTY